jgi:hypothetical protein
VDSNPELQDYNLEESQLHVSWRGGGFEPRDDKTTISCAILQRFLLYSMTLRGIYSVTLRAV